MGGIGNIIKSVAPMALSFLPGPFGKIASAAAGSLLEGNQAQGQGNSAVNTAVQGMSPASQVQSQYYHPLFAALASQSGIGPNGQFDPSFDPYSQSGNSLISKYGDKVADQNNQAVNSTAFDLGGRGFNGQNSLSPSLMSNMQRSAGQDVANYGRNLGVESENARYQRLGQALQMMQPTNAGGLLGAGNYYQNQANQGSQSASGLAGAAGQAGMTNGNPWTDILGGLFHHGNQGSGNTGMGGTSSTPGINGGNSAQLPYTKDSQFDGVKMQPR